MGSSRCRCGHPSPCYRRGSCDRRINSSCRPSPAPPRDRAPFEARTAEPIAATAALQATYPTRTCRRTSLDPGCAIKNRAGVWSATPPPSRRPAGYTARCVTPELIPTWNALDVTNGCPGHPFAPLPIRPTAGSLYRLPSFSRKAAVSSNISTEALRKRSFSAMMAAATEFGRFCESIGLSPWREKIALTDICSKESTKKPRPQARARRA